MSRRFRIKLSDPWELGESLNWPTIFATTDLIECADREMGFIFTLDEALPIRSKICRWCSASERHFGDSFSLMRIGQTVSANLTFLEFKEQIVDYRRSDTLIAIGSIQSIT